jgi:hypothetical protein
MNYQFVCNTAPVDVDPHENPGRKSSTVSKLWRCGRQRMCSTKQLFRVSVLHLACRQICNVASTYLYSCPIFAFEQKTILDQWLRLRTPNQKKLVTRIDLPFTKRIQHVVNLFPRLKMLYVNERLFDRSGFRDHEKQWHGWESLKVAIIFHTSSSDPRNDQKTFENRLRLTGERPHKTPNPLHLTIVQAGVILPVVDGNGMHTSLGEDVTASGTSRANNVGMVTAMYTLPRLTTERVKTSRDRNGGLIVILIKPRRCVSGAREEGILLH